MEANKEKEVYKGCNWCQHYREFEIVVKGTREECQMRGCAEKANYSISPYASYSCPDCKKFELSREKAWKYIETLNKIIKDHKEYIKETQKKISRIRAMMDDKTVCADGFEQKESAPEGAGGTDEHI